MSTNNGAKNGVILVAGALAAVGAVTGAYDADTFYVNTGNIDDLIQALNHVHDAVNNAINDIYTNVEALGNGWEGDDYDEYNKNLTNYRPYLNTLVFFIEAYLVLLKDLSGEATTLATAVDGFLNI